MYCDNCGKKLKEKQQVCLECGALVEEIKKETPKSDKKPVSFATKLCITSLIAKFGVPIIGAILTFIISLFTIFNSNAINIIVLILKSAIGVISGLSYITAFVLVIIAKVKDKDSLFATILLWLYIAELIISIFVAIIVIIFVVLFGISLGTLIVFFA